MVKLKEYTWKLESGRVMSGPSVEISSWGILFENNSLLAKVFMTDHLNKVPPAAGHTHSAAQNLCVLGVCVMTFCLISDKPFSHHFIVPQKLKRFQHPLPQGTSGLFKAVWLTGSLCSGQVSGLCL